MENASKALLMAGGILIALLILSLIATLIVSSNSLSEEYSRTKKTETIQQFNVNFTKYLGQDLTIHEVVTICNFAKIENNKIANVSVVGKNFEVSDIGSNIKKIKEELNARPEYYNIEIIYKLTIEEYNPTTGYISKIKIEEPINKFKCYKKDSDTGNVVIEYKRQIM